MTWPTFGAVEYVLGAPVPRPHMCSYHFPKTHSIINAHHGGFLSPFDPTLSKRTMTQ